VVSDRGGAAPLTGGVSLSDALSALRDELVHAVWAGQYPYQFDGAQRTLRFKPAPIEVTLEVAVTATGEGHAGVKWWLIDAGGAFSREKVTTQWASPEIVEAFLCCGRLVRSKSLVLDR
jgi:Trypsin-co-occurring domain 2